MIARGERRGEQGGRGAGENTTDYYCQICRYFIDAIEQQKYGWFWECPNGGAQCMYVHALPPGYVLKKKKIDEDEDIEEPTPLEEIIEEQVG